MPDTLAGPLTNNLLRRLRNPDAIGITHDFVRSMLSESQRFVNAGLRSMKETVSLTTNPNQQFYNITALLPNAIRIENVREGGRDLRKTTLRALSQINTKFHREVGDSFRHFALVGRDLLVVYPSKASESSVDVVYTKLTNEFVNDDVAIEIIDDDMVEASDLAQIILLTKMREFSMLKPILTQFTERMQKISTGMQ